MAELADAHDSGSCGVTPVEVQVLSFAQKKPRVHLGFFVSAFCADDVAFYCKTSHGKFAVSGKPFLSASQAEPFSVISVGLVML